MSDYITDEFLKAFLRPLPPVTTPEERAVVVGFLKAIDQIASELPAHSRLRMAFRQQAVHMQDRIDEYDRRALDG